MKVRLLLAAAFACLVTASVQGQTFPDKPVKIIMPFPTGVGPDTVMRLVGERLARMWGQQVIVDNRPGGNGFVAIEAARRAAPDGYTFFLADAPLITVTPHLFKRLPVDPRDFEPVASLYRTYYYVTVAADSKWKNVGDLISAAKASPGKLSYGSSGVGGNIHLGGAMMEKAAGIKMTHVPYKETPQIYADISKGEINWAVGTASTTQPMLEMHRVKYLAITAPKRSALFPDVPTVAESQGPANYELQTWVSLFAPRGTPPAIVSKVNADIARVLQDPEIRQRLATFGFEPLIQSPEELKKMAIADEAKFSVLIKELNISLD